MSLQFSDSVNEAGIVELIDELCGTNSTIYSIEKKTRDVNLALDKVFSIIFSSGGKWNFDDSNHTDYPIITTNLVSGQRDYSFTVDENSNLILEILKVQVMGADGVYRDVTPVDQQTGTSASTMTDGQNATGTPTQYDKTATGIFLDLIPSYDKANGLRIFISREGSYFIKTDTTKKPGYAGIYHEYLALRPSYLYSFRNGLPNSRNLKAEMLEMEVELSKFYGKRERDEEKRFVPAPQDYK